MKRPVAASALLGDDGKFLLGGDGKFLRGGVMGRT